MLHILWILDSCKRYKKDIKKTNDIAKLRLLVEQVIKTSKTFNLIAKELPISLADNLDDIVICAALTNLKSPIYK